LQARLHLRHLGREEVERRGADAQHAAHRCHRFSLTTTTRVAMALGEEVARIGWVGGRREEGRVGVCGLRRGRRAD
jgi:hypothetical protein